MKKKQHFSQYLGLLLIEYRCWGFVLLLISTQLYLYATFHTNMQPTVIKQDLQTHKVELNSEKIQLIQLHKNTTVWTEAELKTKAERMF